LFGTIPPRRRYILLMIRNDKELIFVGDLVSVTTDRYLVPPRPNAAATAETSMNRYRCLA
jgi:hypothetical protein